jgi:hypothetical protein
MAEPRPADPRLAEWAARLRLAVGEEKRRSTHARPTRVIARDPILAVIAELEAAAAEVPDVA